MGGEHNIQVALTGCRNYGPAGLDAALEYLLETMGPRVASGDKVLVKPNLVSARKGALACSEPAFVSSLASKFLDLGCSVSVADSPAFGTAAGVARKCGLDRALKPLGIEVLTLDNPAPIELSAGGCIGVSGDALEADLIVNAPRLKAHCQMRVTACVKNLFGCVAGMRKAVAHHRLGERGNRFESMIMDVAAALPPVFSVLDAVTAMHVTGPSGGRPIDLGFLAAGDSVAVDTAVYGMLGLEPVEVALWREARQRNLPQAFSKNLEFPLKQPADFRIPVFIIPQKLDPVSFNPWRLATGAVKRLKERFCG